MIIFSQSTDFNSGAFGSMCFTLALTLQIDIGYHGHDIMSTNTSSSTLLGDCNVNCLKWK